MNVCEALNNPEREVGKGKETFFFTFTVVDRGSKQVGGFPRADSIISRKNSPEWENEVHGEAVTDQQTVFT